MTEPVDPRERIEVELRRLGDRLRGAPPARAESDAPAVREVLQALADTAARVEACGVDPLRGAATAVAARTVPELPASALGDQLQVLGTDVLVASAGLAGDQPVPAATADARAQPGTVSVEALLVEVADRLTALRRTL